jgi:hypothetical protein
LGTKARLAGAGEIDEVVDFDAVVGDDPTGAVTFILKK